MFPCFSSPLTERWQALIAMSFVVHGVDILAKRSIPLCERVHGSSSGNWFELPKKDVMEYGALECTSEDDDPPLLGFGWMLLVLYIICLYLLALIMILLSINPTTLEMVVGIM